MTTAEHRGLLRLGALLVGTWALCLLLLVLAQGANAAATTQIAVSDDPTEDLPVNITISGTTSGARTLFALVTTAGSCGATYDANGAGSTLAGASGTSVSSGYSRNFPYIPTAAVTYRVCSYVATGSSATPDAVGETTFAPRRIRASSVVEVSADPTEDKAVSITVSGSVEAGRTLFALVTTAGSCGATYDANGAGSTLAGASGTSVSSGYSRTFPYIPTAAMTYRVCTYVAEGSSSSPDVIGQTTFAARRLATSLAITVDRSLYLAGEQRTATISGSSEGSGTLDTAVVAGADCPAPPAFGPAVSPGAYSISTPVNVQQNDVVSICAWLQHDGAVYASDHVVLTKKPIDVPVASATAPAGRIDNRKPIFGWSTSAGYADDFVLTDRQGATILLVGQDGAWVPNGDATQTDVDDADEYYDDDQSSTKSARAGYDKVKGAATYMLSGEQATVKLSDALPPGSYRWFVNRQRGDGASAVSPVNAFKIAGPALGKLSVKARAHRTTSSANPGGTDVTITTTPYAYVRVALKHGGREKVMNVRWGAHSSSVVPVDWSCKRPGGAFSYTVTASDDDGHERTKHGSFKTITKARCHALKRAEQRARDHRVAARQRRERAAEQRREAAAQRDLQRRIDNCHAINGQARRWTWSDGSTSLVCATSSGVYII